MTSITSFFSHLRPVRALLSLLFLVAIALTAPFPAFAAIDNRNEGVVQLDEITQKSEAVNDKSTTKLNPLNQPAEKGLNEIQGTADRDQMVNVSETKLPVIKRIQQTMSQWVSPKP